MPEKKDLTGKRFGNLTAIEEGEPHYTSGGHKKIKWVCRCDCGKTISVPAGNLNSGNTKSCGCLQKEMRGKNNYSDLTGQKFGRLKVLKRCGSTNNKKALWLCECECGSRLKIPTGSLKSGNTKSCGCYQIKRATESNIKHNGKGTRIYAIWAGIKSRCLNDNDTAYHHYGGRGITICDEWKNDFMAFRKWALENGYTDDLSIDRIDVNGDYEPSNCRWADGFTQANNMTRNVNITYKGETHTATEWSRITGIPYKTILYRYRKGKILEEVFKK